MGPGLGFGLGEIESHDRALVEDEQGDADGFCLSLQRLLQALGGLVHPINSLRGQMFDGNSARQTTERIAVERTAMIDAVVGTALGAFFGKSGGKPLGHAGGYEATPARWTSSMARSRLRFRRLCGNRQR